MKVAELEKTMKFKCGSLVLLSAHLLCVAGAAFALHTDPTRIEAGDMVGIAIPYESMRGGIAPIKNVRLEIGSAPVWVDVDTVHRRKGPWAAYSGSR